MAGLIFDIEANGLLDSVTKIHCLALMEEDETNVQVFGGPTDEKIRNVLSHLEDASCLIGHNILDYDIRALQKVYPSFKPRGKKLDTLICSQLIWTDLRNQDFMFRRKHPDFPGNQIGRHGLKAWGYRLGEFKGVVEDEEDGSKWYEQWSPELEAYCAQDVRVNKAFLDLIKSKQFSQQAIDLEMELKQWIILQEEAGAPFDEEAAKVLYAELAAERAELEHALSHAFPPWIERTKFVPKRDNAKRGYKAGVPFDKEKVVTFNPRSHKHVAERLKAQRGWQPEEFTETGDACTDSDVMESLAEKWEECKLLARHAEIQKIIGMVAEGKSAYLKLSKNGRIHGRIKTCGTVTGRCSHVDPNLGNIPRKGDLGHKVRALFKAPAGYSLVGCDAKGLELRMLAHFIARYDGGKYVEVVTKGDPHSYHQELAGLPTRDTAKTFIYAFIYGGGDGKIGLIVGKGAAVGKKLRYKFLRQFPALDELKNAVEATARSKGFLLGLDKRKLHVRSLHSALNTLLQSAGALVMKMAVILFNRECDARGWLEDGSVRQVLFVHDETQSLVRNGMEEEVKSVKIDCIRKAGEYFGLRCPTDGDSKSGADWSCTH